MNLKIKANLNKLNNHIKFIISALRCCEVCTFLSVWVRRVRRIQVPRMKGYKWSHTPECWWRQRLKGRGSGMMMTRSACRQYVENVRDWVQIYVHRLSTAGPAGGIWQQELLQVLEMERKKSGLGVCDAVTHGRETQKDYYRHSVGFRLRGVHSRGSWSFRLEFQKLNCRIFNY